jgi:hypothetical protein
MYFVRAGGVGIVVFVCGERSLINGDGFSIKYNQVKDISRLVIQIYMSCSFSLATGGIAGV